MNTTLLFTLLSLIPSIGICVFVYIKDRKEKEPVWLLCTLFGVSALVYYPARLLGNNLVNPLIGRLFSESYTMDPLNGIQWESQGLMVLHNLLCALIGVGLLEKLACWFVLYFLTARNRNFNCTWDGVVYSVCVSMGASFSKSCLFAITLGGDQFILRFLRSFPWDLATGIIMGVLYTAWFYERRANIIENRLLRKGKLRRNVLHYPLLSLIESISLPVIFRALQNTAFEQAGELKPGFGRALLIVSFAVFAICFASIIFMSRRDRTIREAAEETVEAFHGSLPDAYYFDLVIHPERPAPRESRFVTAVIPAVLSVAVIGTAVFACFRPPVALTGEYASDSRTDSATVTDVVDSGSGTGADTGGTDADPSGYLPAEPENCYTFYYDSLGEKERKIYDAVYQTLKNGRETAEVTGASRDDRELIRNTVAKVRYDHPELIQYDGSVFYSTYYSDYVKLRFVRYDFWDSTVIFGRYMELMEDRVDRIVYGAEFVCVDDYEKVKYVHDRLVSEAVYDVAALKEMEANPTGYSPELDLIYTAFGCLVNGRCVCAGYANAFKLIMDRLGIPCVFVTGWGSTDPEEGDVGHAWNRVVIDGESYYVDVTWDGYSSCLSESGEQLYPGAISHRYLNITTEDLEKTHTIDEKFAAQPVCTATKYNYYVQSGYLLEEYDGEVFKEMIRQQALLGSVNIRITDLSKLDRATIIYFALKDELLGWENPALFVYKETGHIDIVKKRN